MFKEIYQDSLYLNNNKKNKSCLLLLLCLIDGLSKKYYPNIKGQKERYCKYLKEKLKKVNLDCIYRVEEKNKLLHLSDIIYEYFRCYFIHEIDDRTSSNYEVQIEYNINSKKFIFNSMILIDRQNKQIIVKCDKLIYLLQGIIKKDLKLIS